MVKMFKVFNRLIIFIIRNSYAIIMRVIFSFFPVQKNKIFMMSYSGTKYSCNPKALTDYILSNYDDINIIWGFNKKYFQHIQLPLSINKVAINSLKFFYHYYTSKIIVYNMRLPYNFYKKRNQYYIQTWHNYLAFKAIEKEAKNMLNKSYLRSAKKDSKKMNLLLSSSRFTTEQYRRCFWYDGPILEKGTPRNDLLFTCNEETINQIKKEINVENKRVVLYAPTFRNNEGISFYRLNNSLLIDSLRNKFGDEWIILYRLHPNLINIAKDLDIGANSINVSSYNDMQNLLLISDVLISDFSSSIFDFMFTEKPCFLYLKKLNDYLSKERPITIDLKELPFSISENEAELVQNINEFDHNLYKEKIKVFNEKFQNFEEGNACKELMKIIENVIKG